MRCFNYIISVSILIIFSTLIFGQEMVTIKLISGDGDRGICDVPLYVIEENDGSPIYRKIGKTDAEGIVRCPVIYCNDRYELKLIREDGVGLIDNIKLDCNAIDDTPITYTCFLRGRSNNCAASDNSPTIQHPPNNNSSQLENENQQLKDSISSLLELIEELKAFNLNLGDSVHLIRSELVEAQQELFFLDHSTNKTIAEQSKIIANNRQKLSNLEKSITTTLIEVRQLTTPEVNAFSWTPMTTYRRNGRQITEPTKNVSRTREILYEFDTKSDRDWMYQNFYISAEFGWADLSTHQNEVLYVSDTLSLASATRSGLIAIEQLTKSGEIPRRTSYICINLYYASLHIDRSFKVSRRIEAIPSHRVCKNIANGRFSN